MQIIKRNIIAYQKDHKEIKFFGYNSKGTLSIVFEDDTIMNINEEELEALKNFLEKCGGKYGRL